MNTRPVLTEDEAFARLNAAKIWPAPSRRAYYALIATGGGLTARELAPLAGVARSSPRVIPVMAPLIAAGLVSVNKERRPCSDGCIRLTNVYYPAI